MATVDWSSTSQESEMDTTEVDTTESMTSEETSMVTSPSTTSVTSQETSPATTITTLLTTSAADWTTLTDTSSVKPTTQTITSTTAIVSDTTQLFSTIETTSTVAKVTTDVTTEATSSEHWTTTTTGNEIITTVADSPGGAGGLSQGAIVGIAVGASVGVILVIVMIVVVSFCCRKRQYRSSQNNYIDGGESPNDYVVRTSQTERQRISAAASPTPSSFPHAVPFKNENHYAVSGVNAFNNPMYSEGLQLTDHMIPSTKPEEVAIRKNGVSKEERALQAASRASMGPILLGEDATYDQMYKTTGTFKE